MDNRMVLSLDGSTGSCSVALLSLATSAGRAGTWEVAAARSGGDGRAQAKVLLPLVDDMLGDLGREPGSLAAVVVGNGPGTFTGVRITVATARALALSLGIPVLGVSTLAGLAARGAREIPTSETIVSVVDARRGQVFYSIYVRSRPVEEDPTPRWERATPMGVCDRADLAATVDAETGGGVSRGRDEAVPVTVVGEPDLRLAELLPGARRVEAEMRAEWLVRGQESLSEPGFLPEGDRLGPWLRQVMEGEGQAGGSGATLAMPGQPGTPESVKPIYVRAPDADIHITKMRDPWAPGPA